jgi:hypothetical protein
MKKSASPNGRKHGLRARVAASDNRLKKTLTFEPSAQVYHWTTVDFRRSRLVIKH